MPILKTEADLGKYLTDPSRIISNAHLEVVCQRGKGANTCRYLSSVAQGWTCVKNTPLKAVIDQEVRANAGWRAKGNNCDGFGEMNAQKEQDHEDSHKDSQERTEKDEGGGYEESNPPQA